MKISLVYAVRDPDYGRDLLHRMQVSLSTFAELARLHELDYEFVVVEWNPPPGKKPIAELVDWEPQDRGRLRVIEVPPAVHADFASPSEMRFLEYVAKNAGIRRARGDWILACSPDVLFNDALVRFLAESELDGNAFYRIDRRDVDCRLSLSHAAQRRLRDCARHVTSVHSRFGSIAMLPHSAGRRDAIPGLVRERHFEHKKAYLKRNTPRWHVFGAEKLAGHACADVLLQRMQSLRVQLDEVHTNACGDFLLMSRNAWLQLRGYTELTTHAHIDSIMCWTAALAGMQQVILSGKTRLYHQEHDRSETRDFPMTDLNEWQERTLSALACGTGLITNGDDWGLADRELQEIVR